MIKVINSLSIVIPVFNSAPILKDLILRVKKSLDNLDCSYEVILVNDGSRDQSWPIIQELSKSFHWVRGINLMRNYGQHNALLCGIKAAKNEIIITMDDDLQNPPEEISKLITKLFEGYDVVYGTPIRERHTLLRNFASKITKFALQSTMGATTARNVSAFRAFRTKIRDSFEHYHGPFVSIDVLLTWGTSRFTSILVDHESRKVGKSNYTLKKLIIHALNMITGFSTLPLRFASLVGFVLTLFGFGILIYVIGRYFLLGGKVPGFSFLASAISIFSGAQLFALGIIGEYLARMHFRIMNKPSYAIRETVNFGGQQDNDRAPR